MKRIYALLICLTLGVACLTSCSNNEEVFKEKTYTAGVEQIAKLCIDVLDRQIEVTPSADNQIHIGYFESPKEYYNISVSNEKVLTMTTAINKDWTDYIGKKSSASSRKISLQLPDALLTTLELSTTNEDISLVQLTATKNLSLSSIGGNIIFDKLNVENAINLTAKNGNIMGSIIGNSNDYAISCDIKKGKSNLPSSNGNKTKTLKASNNNGDIDIEFKAK